MSTPQRLSIYISADMIELAQERTVAADAVARMRFLPLLSGHGSEPQAAKVFLGIYGAGGRTDVLERDYAAARGMPKLVYVKRVETRDEGLATFLRSVRSEDQVSYKPFSDAAELEELIQNDLALTLTERFGAATEAPPSLGRAALPRPLTAMIGREGEAGTVVELLSKPDVRLVSLVGPGGIGKTRLALDVAARSQAVFGDGVYFVPLAPVKDPDLLMPTIARALSISETGTSTFETAVANLRGRDALLVLDNFEHLLAAAGAVGRLLGGTDRTKVIVTTRALLHVRGENAVEVPPLQLPDGDGPADGAAVELFIARATEVDPAIKWDSNTIQAAAEICHRVDGLPLAIELAAARCRVLAPEAILERIRDSFELLRGRARDLPERQLTLESTIDWSYQLLETDEKRLFERLSVFPAAFALEGAEALAPAGADVLGILSSLLDKSLLRRVMPGIGGVGQAWFGMLETIRQFAARKLESGGQAEETYRQHAAWFRSVVTHAAGELRGPRQKYWLERAEYGHDNLRSALRWTLENDPKTLIELVIGVSFFWEVRGYLNEGRTWTERAIEACDPDERADLGRLHRSAGRLARAQGQLADAERHHRAALEIARAAADRDLEAFVLKDLGVVALERRQYSEARALFEESLALARELDDIVCMAETLNNIGIVERFEDRWPAARAAIEEALRLFRQIEDQQGVARALMNLGTAHRGLSEFDAAIDLYRQSLVQWRGVGGRWMIAECMEQIALILAYRSDPERSGRLLGAAERIRELIGAPWSGSEQDLMSEYVAKVKKELASRGSADLWEEGRGMDIDEAVDLALSS